MQHAFGVAISNEMCSAVDDHGPIASSEAMGHGIFDAELVR
ncbi:hypothetical protein [Olsenella sp. An293]|nr:hypothetical protein [Olsenella sp. An293]